MKPRQSWLQPAISTAVKTNLFNSDERNSSAWLRSAASPRSTIKCSSDSSGNGNLTDIGKIQRNLRVSEGHLSSNSSKTFEPAQICAILHMPYQAYHLTMAPS